MRCVDVGEVVHTFAEAAAGAAAGIPVAHSIPHYWSQLRRAAAAVAWTAACRSLPAARGISVIEACSHVDVELARKEASAAGPSVEPVVAGRTAVEAERRQSAKHWAHRTNCRCLVGVAQGVGRRRHQVLAAAVIGTELADTGLARMGASAFVMVRALSVLS